MLSSMTITIGKKALVASFISATPNDDKTSMSLELRLSRSMTEAERGALQHAWEDRSPQLVVRGPDLLTFPHIPRDDAAQVAAQLQESLGRLEHSDKTKAEQTRIDERDRAWTAAVEAVKAAL